MATSADAATSTTLSTITTSATATTSSSSTSRTPDAQTWVFPPPGPSVLPIVATSNFGPVAYGDTMLLEWSPETRPEIYMSCFSQTMRQTTFKVVTAGAARTPFNYQMNFKANSTGTSDLAFCHYWFNPSSNGNSGNFQYLNDPAATAQTFSAANLRPTGSSSSSSRSSATATPSSSQSGQASSSSSHDGGLSAGAKAGIGIGVAIGIIALIFGLFLFMRKRRQNTVQQAAFGPPSEMYGGAPYGKSATYSVYEKRISTPPVEMDAGVVGHEMPGVQKS